MLLICKILNKTKLKFKQISFEDFIGTSFGSVDAVLLLIWINNFQLCFRFRRASCPVLPAVLIISRGECILTLILGSGSLNKSFFALWYLKINLTVILFGISINFPLWASYFLAPSCYGFFTVDEISQN